MTTLGFRLPSDDADDRDSRSALAELAEVAIASGAVDLNRVLAFMAARHMLGDRADRYDAEEIADLADWLSGKDGPEGNDDDGEDGGSDEDDEEDLTPPRPEVELRDRWSPILLTAAGLAAGWFMWRRRR